MSKRKGTGLRSVIKSVLAAAFGVQKREKLEEDFQEGNPAHFIIAGIVGTVLFILILLALVQIVLHISQ